MGGPLRPQLCPSASDLHPWSSRDSGGRGTRLHTDCVRPKRSGHEDFLTAWVRQRVGTATEAKAVLLWAWPPSLPPALPVKGPRLTSLAGLS